MTKPGIKNIFSYRRGGAHKTNYQLRKLSLTFCEPFKKTMLKISSYIVFLFTLVSCSVHNSDCKRFHAGIFRASSDFDGVVTVIERNDSLQIEQNKTSGSVTKARVHWINDCEYELNVIKQGNDAAQQSEIHSYIQNHKLITKILSTSKDYYIFESSIDGLEIKLTDTLFVVK